jgi:hypothetical protein
MRGPRIGECDVNYDLSRAVAILRAAHAEMVTEGVKGRPAAMGDLELAGVKTGAVRVPAKRKRAKAA